MYRNCATVPVAAIVRSFNMSLYVPEDCVDDDVVMLREPRFVYEIWVMFAITVFVATGSVSVSATVSWSEPRLWTLFAISATRVLNLLYVAILVYVIENL